MSYVGKKKIDQINSLSFIHDVIEQSATRVDEAEFLNFCPETWSEEENKIYGMLCELDFKLKDAILNIIEPPKVTK